MEEITFNRIHKSQDGQRIDLFIQFGGKNFPLYFQSNGLELGIYPESFIAAVLLPAMKAKVSLIRVEDEVSPVFIQNINEIQRVFQSWKPNYRSVEIKSKLRPPFIRNGAGKTGLFFSAGIDSYYSFFTRRGEIDVLIYLDGFDVPLKYTGLRERLRQNIRRISESLQFPIITVETNLRDFHEHFLSWSFSHGSALASVGYLFADHLSKIWIAPVGNPAITYPFGSHPDLDPHWSSDILVTTQDPHDTNKIEKLRYISQFDPVDQTLRVCYQFPRKGINCGVCEKCLRTMVYLQAAGIYEDFISLFDKPLNTQVLARFHNTDEEDVDMLYRALHMLEEQKTYPETARALRKALYPDPYLLKIKRRLRRLTKPIFIRRK